MYIDDFVDAIEQLILTKSQGVYNICSNNQYKIKDIILTICKLLKYKKHLTFDDNLNTNNLKPKYMCGNNEKIKMESKNFIKRRTFKNYKLLQFKQIK